MGCNRPVKYGADKQNVQTSFLWNTLAKRNTLVPLSTGTIVLIFWVVVRMKQEQRSPFVTWNATRVQLVQSFHRKWQKTLTKADLWPLKTTCEWEVWAKRQRWRSSSLCHCFGGIKLPGLQPRLNLKRLAAENLWRLLDRWLIAAGFRQNRTSQFGF